MRKILAFALFLGLAFAEIAAPVDLFFKALGIEGNVGTPIKLKKGQVQVEALDGLLYKVHYVGPAEAADEAGKVLAAALGYKGFEETFVKWYQANRQAIAKSQRPLRVGIEPVYLLEIQTNHTLRYTVGPYEIPENAFGKPRHVLGEKGPLIREYSDFYCPYCQKLALEVLPKIKKELVKQGLARFEYRHFPLIEIHPDAFQAAEASECAAEQGKFWPYHDLLFATLRKRHGVDYLELAKTLGLNTKTFETCLKTGKYRDVVKAMRAEAESLGLQGTPTVFVGPFKLANPFDLEAYKRYVRMAAALSKKGK